MTGMVSIYADGSSTGKSNAPGGWAFVIVIDDKPVRANYGGESSTTNNKMEMRASIEGLKEAEKEGYFGPGFALELVSDSQVTLGLASGAYNAHKNQDLADELKDLVARLEVKRFRWVKGHDGDVFNCRCDSLAKRGKKEIEDGIITKKSS